MFEKKKWELANAKARTERLTQKKRLVTLIFETKTTARGRSLQQINSVEGNK